MGVDIPRLRQRYLQLCADSANFRSVCDEIEKYIMPRVGGDSHSSPKQSESEATWRNPDVWDNTAPIGLAKLAAHIHTSVAPPGVKAATLEWDDPKFRDDQAAKEILEKNGELVHREIESSDFHGELASALVEYVGLGNMIVVEEVDDKTGRWKGFDFTAPPVRECEFEDDTRGRMRVFYRRLNWTPVQILDRFGEKGTPEAIRTLAGSPAEGVKQKEVVFCIWPREDVIAREEQSPIAAPDQRPFGYVHFLLETGEQLGEEGGYFDFPAFIARWERTPGSRWGQGLGHYALPGVKGLNSYKELMLTRAALDVDPPTKGTERGLWGDIDRRPGGHTVVENLDDIAPLDAGMPARHDVGAMTLEEERAEVRRVFREDQLELKDSPQMSATEAQIRYDIMLKLLGPTIARLLSEFLAPLYEVAYRALYRANRLEQMPVAVIEANAQWSVKFLGAIARSKRTDDVASIERLFTFGASLLKLGWAEAEFVLSPEKALRHVQELLGAPAGCLRSPAEVAQLVKARREMESRMLQAKAAKDEADAASKMGMTGGGAAAPVQAGAFPLSPAPALEPGGAVVP